MTSAQPSRRHPRYEPLVNGRRVAVSAGERGCSHPDCDTRLSRYNPDSTCSRHGGWSDDSLLRRGRKPARRLVPDVAAQCNGTGRVGVTAEIVLESGTWADEHAALVRRVLDGAGPSVSVERMESSARLTGAVGDVLEALERVYEEVASTEARVVTHLQFDHASGLGTANGRTPAAPT